MTLHYTKYCLFVYQTVCVPSHSLFLLFATVILTLFFLVSHVFWICLPCGLSFLFFLCLFFQTLCLPSVWDCSSVQIDSMSTVSYKTVVQWYSGTAWVFLYQCEILFMHQPRPYRSDSNMCEFMLSLLTGRALSWPSAVWNGDTLCLTNYNSQCL